jgi:glycine cleavage system regulatory protein
MPDLETLLRDVRPAPDPAWAARLDARAAARFPGPPPRWKAPLIALREHLLAVGAVATVATALIVVVSTVSFSGSDDSASTASSGSSSSAQRRSAEDSAGGSGSAAAKPAAPSIAPALAPQTGAATPGRDRAVLKNASLTLSVPSDEVDSVTDRAIRVVDGAGGHVQSSEVNSSGATASATLTLKLPTAKLDASLAQLSKLAHVRARSQQAEDVTDQRAALEAAVRDARADRAGLRARLAKATTDRERSRLRALLDRASRRVTSRERDVAQLGAQVAYATVALDIEGVRRPSAAAPTGRWTPGDALSDAGRVLEVIAGVLVIALAVLVPVGVLAGLGALASRPLMRRRRERALELA